MSKAPFGVEPSPHLASVSLPEHVPARNRDGGCVKDGSASPRVNAALSIQIAPSLQIDCDFSKRKEMRRVAIANLDKLAQLGSLLIFEVK